VATPLGSEDIFLKVERELTIVKPTAVLFFLAFLIGCGGNVVSPTAGTTMPAPGPSGGTAPLSVPNVVTLSAGQTASSVDIAVSAPASLVPPNAQDLGVAALTGRGSAANTGDIIHRGQTMRVLLFGPGLSGDMQVSVRGPNDITISNITAITSTNNTPGLSFTAVVAPDAALGVRTVVLQSSNGDVTTFTGGLEVVP
jgi:hypothetical protein